MKIYIGHNTTVGMALAAEPRLYGALIALGLCCVDENTVMWTMARLADEVGVDVDELCSALNSSAGGFRDFMHLMFSMERRIA